MNRTLGNEFALSILLIFSVPGFARTPADEKTQPAFSINVRVYDHAQIPSEELARAKEEATKVFRRAQIGIDWVDCPVSVDEAQMLPTCRQLPGPGGHVVRIFPRSSASDRHSALFGYGLLPKEGSPGFYAVVFADSADKLGKGDVSFRRRILGLIMAHEIGHLLLATRSHALGGIMHFPWSAPQLGLAAQGALSFTPRQANKMRAQVREQMCAVQARLEE